MIDFSPAHSLQMSVLTLLDAAFFLALVTGDLYWGPLLLDKAGVTLEALLGVTLISFSTEAITDVSFSFPDCLGVLGVLGLLDST